MKLGLETRSSNLVWKGKEKKERKSEAYKHSRHQGMRKIRNAASKTKRETERDKKRDRDIKTKRELPHSLNNYCVAGTGICSLKILFCWNAQTYTTESFLTNKKTRRPFLRDNTDQTFSNTVEIFIICLHSQFNSELRRWLFIIDGQDLSLSYFSKYFTTISAEIIRPKLMPLASTLFWYFHSNILQTPL